MTEAEKAYQYFVIAVPENEEQAKAYFWARKALQSTLTQPNELLTLQELKAEAKRQGYKLIKDENIRFEPCLCGGTRHEWWSGPEGVKVVCLRCGLESPWVPRSKGKNGVKKVWNAMILKNRKEQSHEDV